METVIVRTLDHPEANGRAPTIHDVFWVVRIPLEDNRELEIHMGKAARDRLFGQMICEYQRLGEPEPA